MLRKKEMEFESMEDVIQNAMSLTHWGNKEMEFVRMEDVIQNTISLTY